MNDYQKPRTIMEMMKRIELLEDDNARLRRARPKPYKATETLRKIRAFVNVSSISNPTIRLINEILNQNDDH